MYVCMCVCIYICMYIQGGSVSTTLNEITVLTTL